ncbi:2-amino-4-ketopentanoate thiolase alpha subunit [subsurface metagenome]
MIKKGTWVQIHYNILEIGERAPQVPDDTKKVPLEMWDKGFLIDEEANIGDIVNVETYIGRKIRGRLIEINPSYDHNYGKCIPELLYIGRQTRELLKEGKAD